MRLATALSLMAFGTGIIALPTAAEVPSELQKADTAATPPDSALAPAQPITKEHWAEADEWLGEEDEDDWSEVDFTQGNTSTTTTHEKRRGFNWSSNKNPPKPSKSIAWGWQRQKGDAKGDSHWIAWIEGNSPCDNKVVLREQRYDPCGVLFSLPEIKEGSLRFDTCDRFGSGNPGSVDIDLYDGGAPVMTCTTLKKGGKQLKCKGKPRDVIKKGVCDPN